MTPPRLELTRISKRYPGVVANHAVSLTVQAGEIHAVLGENGAGKSTLMKIIYGAVLPDEGSVCFNGQPVRIRNPREARALGISMVFQHFSLFGSLSVAENVWLGLDQRPPPLPLPLAGEGWGEGCPKAGELVQAAPHPRPLPGVPGRGSKTLCHQALTLAEVTGQIRAKAEEYGLEIDPERPVHGLSVGEMQRVEIIRALLSRPQLLILDEPTSVLTPQAIEKLFVVLKLLAAQGCAILYISHKLDEIRELCSACTVLRGGVVTGHCDPRQESHSSLSRLMIGAEPPALNHQASQAGATVLELDRLTLVRESAFGVDLIDLSLRVRAGEVVGIAGVSGNGQRELLYALSGEDRRARPEAIVLAGQPVGRLGPMQRRALGLHFVPEERLGRGAVPSLSLAHNLLLTRSEALGRAGWISLKALRAQARQFIERFQVKAAGPDALASSLSGGNLQKFIVGREISAKPRLLIISQPTWGVDVGAAAQIRAEILALRDAGCAVLLLSEELDELFELSDQLHVMAKGRLSPALERSQASVSLIGAWMSGLWHEEGLAHVQA